MNDNPRRNPEGHPSEPTRREDRREFRPQQQPQQPPQDQQQGQFPQPQQFGPPQQQQSSQPPRQPSGQPREGYQQPQQFEQQYQQPQSYQQSQPPTQSQGAQPQGGQQHDIPPQGGTPQGGQQPGPPSSGRAGGQRAGQQHQQANRQQMGQTQTQQLQSSAPVGEAQPTPQRMDTGPRLRPVTLDDIVESDVVTVEPETEISTVVSEMAEEDVGSVVVVDDERPVGILTDRTIALALREMPDVSERTVEEISTDRELVTASVDTTVFEALATLGDVGVRRLPIVDEEEHLVGIVTLDDIIVLLGTELENAAEIIKSQTPRF